MNDNTDLENWERFAILEEKIEELEIVIAKILVSINSRIAELSDREAD
tara:strand:- start:39 stop:182 length:144 start_codon:yes stop_codon:yes gene_type:complete